MNTVQRVKKSSWPKQTALIISEAPNLHMLMREMLRPHNWTVLDSNPSIENAMTLVQKGHVSLLICDDTPVRPSTRSVRHLFTDPATICTPILALVLDSHKNEIAALGQIGRTAVSEKPMTPSKFVPAFVGLVRAWEKDPLLTVRRANYLMLSGQSVVGLKLLMKLSETPSVSSLCAQALALHLRAVGKQREAETILLTALKKNPKEIGTVLVLANLYMRCAMPKLAHRLLLTAQMNVENSHALLPDLVQASLMMGRMSEAIEYLYKMHRAGITDEETTSSLARLLFAEGREGEAEKVLLYNKTIFRRLQDGWTSAELQTTPAAS